MLSIANPYGDRKPVADPSQFYGRGNDLLFLAHRLNAGQSCALSGEPLTGKTSLLFYLAHPQGARTLPQFIGPDPSLFVIIEPARLYKPDTRTMVRYLVDRVVQEAGRSNSRGRELVRDWAPEDDYAMQRSFEHTLKGQEQRIVLLFDDFDILLKELAKDDAMQLMYYLRTPAQACDLGGLTYLFMSTDPLPQVLKSIGLSTTSPLPRMITASHSLKLLEEEEIELAINGPLRAASGEEFSSYKVALLKQVAGRHPALLKIACFHLFEADQRGEYTQDEFRELLRKDPTWLWIMETLWQRVEQAEGQEHLPLIEGLIRLARGYRLEGKQDETVVQWLHQRGFIDCSAAHPWILGSLFAEFVEQRASSDRSSAVGSKVGPKHPQEPLTPLEDKLYRYLAQRHEQTCGRQELQEAIWGENPPGTRDALEQLVKRLRGKIEAHPEYPEYLLTVRGQGYLLREKRKS